MKIHKVLVVAISPPPFGGQALMVESMLKASYEGIKLYHVRMGFSDSMKAVGKVSLQKIGHMFSIVFRSLYKRFLHGITTLYYVPGGSGNAPVIRDMFILLFLRPFFRKIIFHFHAAGVSEVVQNLPAWIRFMAHQLYNKSDLAIYLSDRNPDHHYFISKQSIIVTNGIEDEAIPYLQNVETEKKEIMLLFVGVLQQSKGVRVLIECLSILAKRKLPVKVTLVGEFASSEFEKEVIDLCRELEIESRIIFTGIQIGQAKWQHFAAADIFCFPSFFESESFGNVVVEAMMFRLPVIATYWRGIPDIVDNNKTGLLVPPQDSEAFARATEQLILNTELRKEMGRKGREKYLEKYQLSSFTKSMQTAFNVVLNERIT